MNVLNIDEYQSGKWIIDTLMFILFFFFLVSIVNYTGLELLSWQILSLGFINFLFHFLLCTKLYQFSLLYGLFLCNLYFYLLISGRQSLLLIIISLILFCLLYYAIVGQKKLLQEWKHIAGINHSFIDLTHNTYIIHKSKYQGDRVSIKIFWLKFPSIIFFCLLGYFIFVNMSKYPMFMILIPMINFPILSFLRDVEREIISRSGIYANLEATKKVITVLRSHVFDSHKILIDDNDGFSSSSKIEFIKAILNGCMLPPCYLAIRDDPNFCPRCIGSSISDESRWKEDIYNFMKKSPLIILILGKIIDRKNKKYKGLKDEIEIIDKYEFWDKILLIIPPKVTKISSQEMWDDIKNNIVNLQNTNLSIKNKTIGYMFNQDRMPKLELQANEKDKNSYQDAISIAASILL